MSFYLGSKLVAGSNPIDGSDYIHTSQKGIAGGVASLDASGKVPKEQLTNNTLIVTVTKDGDTYTADRTYAEITAELDAGGRCEAVYVNGDTQYVMQLVGRYNGLLTFGRTEYMSGLLQASAHIFESGSVGFYTTILNTHIPAGDGRLVEVDVSTGVATGATLSKLQYIKIGRLVHISVLLTGITDAEKDVSFTLPNSMPNARWTYWHGYQTIPVSLTTGSNVGTEKALVLQGAIRGVFTTETDTEIWFTIPNDASGYTCAWIDGSYISAE